MTAADSALWTPPAPARRHARVGRLMDMLEERHGARLPDYAALHAFSVQRLDDFWRAVWEIAEVRGTPGDVAFQPAAHMKDARFFPAARLNFAENLLRHEGDEVALLAVSEQGRQVALSRNQLRARVAAFAAALKEAGIEAGDRVCAVVPNGEQAIIAFLACASIGAVFSSASPDFGVRGLLDRFGQLEPKLLIAAESVHYNGRHFPLAGKLKALLAELPGVQRAVIFPCGGGEQDAQALAADLAGGIGWSDFIAPHAGAAPTFAPLPFDHPLFILFSSGTTGKPKCIVHRAGGILLKHACEHLLNGDLRADDVLFYYTTCGWMMWNWLVSGLLAGARLVLYDGSPFHPGPQALFALAERTGITRFGISAKFVDAVHKAGYDPARHHDLGRIRTVYSTGSPLAPAGFDFIHERIAPQAQIASISGGTDICGCFVGGNPLSPVWRGEIQGPMLGMAVDVFDAQGRPCPPGVKGELVCTQPFPSQPLGFFGDAAGERYFGAYYARFDNVWWHGDFAEWTEHGGMIIHGRSDATLNPGGVRIGTAEIYAQLEEMDEVVDAVAVGQRTPDMDERVVLFVVLREEIELDDELRQRIRARIRAGASPRHVPAVIARVSDIPRTRSGKISEIAVRQVIHGEEVANTEALANPEALEEFRNRPELAFDA